MAIINTKYTPLLFFIHSYSTTLGAGHTVERVDEYGILSVTHYNLLNFLSTEDAAHLATFNYARI